MLPLSKDAVHIYVGMTVFLLAVILWQRGRVVAACLVPVFLAAIAMEALDLFDDWRFLGTLRWDASAHDIVNTTFWPLVIVLLTRVRALR
ncbi:MAG: hypothetical protein R3228_10870 [Halioglobus sp.]|nr:hypothetical protein [Halioglobus sp.]